MRHYRDGYSGPGRELLCIECDFCSEKVLRGSYTVESGWTKHGTSQDSSGRGGRTWDACPAHEYAGRQAAESYVKYFNRPLKGFIQALKDELK